MISNVFAVDDPRLADYASLNAVETRREVERRGSFFIAESELVIRELIAARARWPIRSVLVTPKRFQAMADVLEPVAATGVPVFVGPMDVVRAVTGFHIHRGAVASAERGDLPPLGRLLRDASRVAVLEGVTDHENLGSIFRSAAAFDLDAVVLDTTCADPLYRRSVRVSMGHVLHVPFTRAALIDDVRACGFSIAALTPSRDAEPIDSFVRRRLPHLPRLAMVFGSEGAGISGATLAAADHRVRIPTVERVDSLNVSVAAAVAMHRLVGAP